MLRVETNLRFFFHPCTPKFNGWKWHYTHRQEEIPTHIMPMKIIPTRWWKTWKKKWPDHSDFLQPENDENEPKSSKEGRTTFPLFPHDRTSTPSLRQQNICVAWELTKTLVVCCIQHWGWTATQSFFRDYEPISSMECHKLSEGFWSLLTSANIVGCEVLCPGAWNMIKVMQMFPVFVSYLLTCNYPVCFVYVYTTSLK